MAPEIPHLVAPLDWQCIDFISDLHLSEATPQTWGGLANYLQTTPAQAIYVLGDLFEVWVGDDARHEGFEARSLALLASVSKTRHLAFMVGNRDFLVGEDFLRDSGMQLLADPCLLVAHGQRILLSHGDEWCLADKPYQAFRQQVRDPLWRAATLARPLQERRALARQIRDGSEANKRMQPVADWIDLDHEAMLKLVQQSQAQHFIHGHTHRPATSALGTATTRHVLSDWDLDDLTHPRAQVLRLEQGQLTRHTLR